MSNIFYDTFRKEMYRKVADTWLKQEALMEQTPITQAKQKIANAEAELAAAKALLKQAEAKPQPIGFTVFDVEDPSFTLEGVHTIRYIGNGEVVCDGKDGAQLYWTRHGILTHHRHVSRCATKIQILPA
jgi:hypothetical protein